MNLTLATIYRLECRLDDLYQTGAELASDLKYELECGADEATVAGVREELALIARHLDRMAPVVAKRRVLVELAEGVDCPF